MKVKLHYGKAFVSLDIPESNVAGVIEPWNGQPRTRNSTLIREATEKARANDFLEAVKGKRLCVLLEDGTRDAPFDDISTGVFGLLADAASVRFFVCTGTHNADTPENQQICRQAVRAARRTHIRDFKIYVHDYRKDALINAGRTSRGTEVLYNAGIDEAELFLVLSDVKNHYFAGYSNPVKNFVPGICAFRTTEENHSLALDEKSTFGVHPWHVDESRRDNPVAADQLEGMRLIAKDRPIYSFVTISTSGKIQWVKLGPIETVTSGAFTTVDQNNTHSVKPAARLIVSPGGFPDDTTLYIAIRALELTGNAVRDEGEILFLAACPNGVGEEHTMENFYNRLTAPVNEVLNSIEAEYKLFAHKPYKFARLIKRMQKIWMHSEMPDHLVEAAHLHPTQDPQKVVNDWLADDPDSTITVVDGANKVAIYVDQ